MLDHDPYAGLPELPSFTLTSEDLVDGEWLDPAQLSDIMGAGGQDVSPQLSWSGAPEGTKSYVVTVFDPDAPTPSGFWHWCLSNIPADITSLDRGAASSPPAGAVKHRNDGGTDEFVGAAPPPDHGPHRYIVCVTAVGEEQLDVDESASPAIVNFQLFTAGTARAFLTGLHEA